MSGVPRDSVLTSHDLGALALRSRAQSYPSVVSKEQLYASLPLPTSSTTIFYVRLLVLEATGTTRNRNPDSSPLKVHLCVEPLTKDLRFTALSYVWGNYDPTPHTISCRPQGLNSPITSDIPITANCHAALSQIRAQWGEVKLWVDSICIDQDNNEEKSSQIAHMQEIYGWTETVYVWLGKGNRQSDEAMRYLKNRGRWKARFPFTWLAVMSTRPEQREQEKLRFTHGSWRDVFARLRTTFGDGSHRVHLDEVLGRAWGRRAWTLQEIVLARNPIILCGDKVLGWEDLIHAIYSPSYLNPHDHSDNLEHGDRAGSLIAGWSSIIDIWLNIPRQSPDQPMQVTPGSTAVSLATLARKLELEKGISKGPQALSYCCNILCCFWGMTCFAFWIYSTVRFMVMVKARTSLNKGDKVGLWYFVVVAWLCITAIFVGFVRGFLRYFCFILLGGHPGWVLKRATSEMTVVLSGLHVALRERDCTDPRDRAFAMFGILQSLGASFSTPNMRGTVGQTHRLFLEKMLRWQPYSLAMIIDAGYSIDHAPSWVPNWMVPCPSKWLTWRYTIGSRMSATKMPMRSDIVVNGNKLTLRGHSEGQVSFVTSCNPTFDSFLATMLCLLFSIQENVGRRDPYDVPESFLFAVLHGLTPPRRPTTKEVKTFDDNGNETGTETKRLPIWKGPYDFEQRKQEFKTFCRLYELLRTCLPPITNDSPQQATSQEIDIALAVETLKSSRNCCKCFVGIISFLSAEKRCLFLTKSGLVGAGPTNMKLDDEVFLLAGVPVPMILYNHVRTDCFKVRGAALVHGLMHGEQFASKQLKKITLV